MEICFDTMLTETVNCLIYTEFVNVIGIYHNHSVIVDFGGWFFSLYEYLYEMDPYAGYHVKMLDAAPILKDNNNEYLLKEVLVLEADSCTHASYHQTSVRS